MWIFWLPTNAFLVVLNSDPKRALHALRKRRHRGTEFSFTFNKVFEMSLKGYEYMQSSFIFTFKVNATKLQKKVQCITHVN